MLLLFLIPIGFSILFPFAVAAESRQESQPPVTVHIPEEVTCPACRIHLDTVVVLGGEEGEGFLDKTNHVAAGERYYFVVHKVFARDIRVFGRDGTFVRSVGGPGEGPGEYLAINNLWVAPGDTLHVIDAGNLRRTILSQEQSSLFMSLDGNRLRSGERYRPNAGQLSHAVQVVHILFPTRRRLR